MLAIDYFLKAIKAAPSRSDIETTATNNMQVTQGELT